MGFIVYKNLPYHCSFDDLRSYFCSISTSLARELMSVYILAAKRSLYGIISGLAFINVFLDHVVKVEVAALPHPLLDHGLVDV